MTKSAEEIATMVRSVRLWHRLHTWSIDLHPKRWSLTTLYLTQGWPYDARIQVFVQAVKEDDKLEVDDVGLARRFQDRLREYGEDGGLGKQKEAL